MRRAGRVSLRWTMRPWRSLLQLAELAEGWRTEAVEERLTKEQRAILEALEGAMDAEASENWHAALVGSSVALQLWRSRKVGRPLSGPPFELVLEEVNGGWRAVVRWPSIRRFLVGAVAPSQRAARLRGKREAAQWLPRMIEGVCEMIAAGGPQ